MNINITPAADTFIRRMIRLGGDPNCGFRLVVSAGGCSGLVAEFSVENSQQPGDGIFQKDGITFFLPAESRLLLDGVTIDFADTPTQTGFVFYDPKAGLCGCATSGSAAGKARTH